MGKVREAEPFLRTAVSVNPFDPEVHGRLLAVAKETGNAQLLERSSRALALLTGAVPREATPTGTTNGATQNTEKAP